MYQNCNFCFESERRKKDGSGSYFRIGFCGPNGFIEFFSNKSLCAGLTFGDKVKIDVNYVPRREGGFSAFLGTVEKI